jgi:APA family basic amino acid/polyamine antiporter
MPSLFEAFTRKKISHDMDYGLARVLGPWDLTLMGIGAIIGSGIFVLTGQAAAGDAGPAVILSFVLSGVACAAAALAYAELAASVGGCGSAYGYSYAAFGELVAWIIGWDLVLEYGVAVAAVANGWSGYLRDFLALFNVHLPEALIKGPFRVDGAGHPDPGIMNLPAILIILALMGMLLAGVKQSARLNAAVVFIKLLTIFTFIAVAVSHVQPDLWHPFAPFGWYGHAANGEKTGIIAGAALVFFAYIGFDAVSTAVEEARDPQKDVPFGILASLTFCTIIYMVVSAILTGIVHYQDLSGDAPVADALIKIGIVWASKLVTVGVVFGLTTVMLVLYYGLTRILLAMSADGLLPPLFAKVSGKSQVPVHNTVICGVIMAAMAGIFPIHILAKLVNVGTLAAFVLVCIGVIILRVRHPDMKRPFKTPGGFFVPVLGVIFCMFLIIFGLETETYLRFVGWLVLGMLIYFGYSLKHSKQGAAQPAE